MDYINFFINDNKNGFKTKEKNLKKSYPEIYQLILSFCTGELEGLPFKQKIWHFINNKREIVKCVNCDTPLKFKRTINEGYGSYCSLPCANKSAERIERIKETNISRYGGLVPTCSDEIKAKAIQTSIKNHGVDNIFKKKQYIKDKIFEKYGVYNTSKLDVIKNKIRETCIRKYSVSTPLLLDHVRDSANEYKRENFLAKNKNYEILNYDKSELTIHCHVCSNDYKIVRSLFNYRNNANVNPCTICNPVNDLSSIKEKELTEIINSFGLEIKKNDREILSGKEVDILVPDKRIAIEFNGLFYHSDIFVDDDYHLKKTQSAKENGYRLIHIFEDEWIYKKEIVISRLKNVLGLTNNKIFARKCAVKEIDSKTKSKFLIENHIQGDAKSSTNLGLFHDGNLVSVMTFSKGRLATKGLKNEYELVRFCNQLDTHVTGGASKLLNYFIRNFRPKEIISYADARWSDGNMYQKLGFELIRKSQPNYFYVIRNRRIHRFNYRKDILVGKGLNPNKSERTLTKELGLYRIYDCGSYVFRLKIEPKA